MPSLFHLLLVGSTLGLMADLTEACSCYPWPPPVKSTYCNSDFVLKVEILDEERIVRRPHGEEDMPDSFSENFATYWYNIDIQKVYRATGFFEEATKKIRTMASHLCGRQFTPGKTYIIMGHYAVESEETFLGASLCSINVDVDRPSPLLTDVLTSLEEGVDC